MKLRDIMTQTVIKINPEESVAVAARILARNNIGSLPVCGKGGNLCGVVTDRDLVIRCLASGKDPKNTAVQEIMTTGVVSASPDMDAAMAASLMGRRQIRRLPVVDNGKLCGMVSLGDMSRRDEMAYDAGDALAQISSNVSNRG